MRAQTITTRARVGGRRRTKRTSVPGGVLALSLAVALSAATASTAGAGRSLYLSDGGPSVTRGAGTAIFEGRTEQGREVRVRVGADGLVNKVKIEDRTRCPRFFDIDDERVRSGHLAGEETYTAPLDESTPSSFADKNRRTDRYGTKRVRVKFEVTGEKISDTKWTGTARRKIIATRRGHPGRELLRCKTGELDWSATLVHD